MCSHSKNSRREWLSYPTCPNKFKYQEHLEIPSKLNLLRLICHKYPSAIQHKITGLETATQSADMLQRLTAATANSPRRHLHRSEDDKWWWKILKTKTRHKTSKTKTKYRSSHSVSSESLIKENQHDAQCRHRNNRYQCFQTRRNTKIIKKIDKIGKPVHHNANTQRKTDSHAHLSWYSCRRRHPAEAARSPRDHWQRHTSTPSIRPPARAQSTRHAHIATHRKRIRQQSNNGSTTIRKTTQNEQMNDRK